MIKKNLLLLLVFCTGTALAQSVDRQVLGAAGASFSGVLLQADYTVGEAITASAIAGSFTISQGFQQNATNTSGITERQIEVNYELYPNPAQDFLTLRLTTKESLELRVAITNELGQSIYADVESETILGTYQRTISTKSLASGLYFLKLVDHANGLAHCIRFSKQ